MEDKLIDQLLEDRLKANEAILVVIKTGNNHLVVEENYLAPTIVNKKMDITEKYGEFQYYSRIRQALEYALIADKIPRKIELSSKIPSYLKELIE